MVERADCGTLFDVNRNYVSVPNRMFGGARGERVAVDDAVLAVKKRDALRSEASNTIDRAPCAASQKTVPRPRINAIMAGSTECVGGLWRTLGPGSRLVRVPLLATMGVAEYYGVKLRSRKPTFPRGIVT